MRFLLVIAFAVLSITSGYSQTLVTPSFVVVIINKDPDGVVSTDNIFYVGVSKKTSDSVKIKGRTVHTLEADGETPKKFLGYEFKKDGITYFVGQEGSLMVTKGIFF